MAKGGLNFRCLQPRGRLNRDVWRRRQPHGVRGGAAAPDLDGLAGLEDKKVNRAFLLLLNKCDFAPLLGGAAVLTWLLASATVAGALMGGFPGSMASIAVDFHEKIENFHELKKLRL